MHLDCCFELVVVVVVVSAVIVVVILLIIQSEKITSYELLFKIPLTLP